MEKQPGLKKSSVAMHCHHCAHAIVLNSSLDETDWVNCERCGHREKGLAAASLHNTLAFSIAGLILYFPAMIFPFMTMELYGNRNTATIWKGVVDLADAGSWGIAFVVLMASIVIPLIKLVILFYLAWPSGTKRAPLKTKLYRFIEVIGRWSMLDIFLLAVLVAIMKLGPWTYVEPEVGSLMFALVVIATMLASASFDPRLLWKDAPYAEESI